jgi:hypothetical protein
MGVFSGCLRLASVNFESGSRLERIAESTFACSGLISIVIPSSVVILGRSSFCGCRWLEYVTFENGSRLERIEECAFSESELTPIMVPTLFESDFWLDRIGLSVISQNRMESGMIRPVASVINGSQENKLKSIVIPCSVVVLGAFSFHMCRALESVTFEKGSRLERIEESAFGLCGLTSIVIPSLVIVLGKSSFRECKSLGSIVFENCYRLERIEESAFYQSGLKSIIIPLSVVVLGTKSFSQCKLLEFVLFENGSRLERIEELAFSESGLKSIVVPPQATSVADSAFLGVFMSAQPSCVVA